MSNQAQIDRLVKAKADIKEAIENKGVPVPSDMTIDKYPALINGIPSSVKIPELVHVKAGSVHKLTGFPQEESGIISCVFLATAGFQAGDTFTVDGTSYTVQLSNGEAAENNLFVSGASVPVVIDTAGKKINFKAGGGLSNSKLALATALVSDVAAGKTFYAGDKALKTGTASVTKFASGVIPQIGYNGASKTITLGWKPKFVFCQFIKKDGNDFFFGTLACVDGYSTGSCGYTYNGDDLDEFYIVTNKKISDMAFTDTGFVATAVKHGSMASYFSSFFLEDTNYWAFG